MLFSIEEVKSGDLNRAWWSQVEDSLSSSIVSQKKIMVVAVVTLR